MDTKKLTNEGIQSFIDETNSVIEPLDMSKHSKLWLTLTLEEILLNYKDIISEGSDFGYKIKKRFGNLLVELSVEGQKADFLHPKGLVAGENGSELIDNLFNTSDGQTLYRYNNGCNIISISLPYSHKPVKTKIPSMVYAIVFAVILGFLFKQIPGDFASILVEKYTSPVYSSILGVLKGLTEPVIFVSLVVGICALDDLKTMGTTGKQILISFLKISTIMYVVSVAVCMIFFKSSGLSASAFDPSTVLSLLLSSIPSNIFSPFTEGNMIQIVLFGFLSGIVILSLGEKSATIRSLLSELKFFLFTFLDIFVKLIPFAVFLSVLNVVMTLSVSESATIWKLIIIDQGLQIALTIGLLLYACINLKVPVSTLVKKIFPIFSVSFVTGSSTAVIPDFYRCLHNKMGVDETFANYWIPLSNAFFSPSTIFALIVYSFFAAQMQNVALSIEWLIILYVMIIEIGMATPRIPGGIIASITILFAQLGLTTDQIGIIMGANVIILYLDTAVAVIIRVVCALSLAKKKGLLDMDVLRRID